MSKREPKAPEYIVAGSMIVPVANVSHILYPDDTVHIRLKNGETLKFPAPKETWEKLKSSFVWGAGEVAAENENTGGGKKP